MYLQLFVLVLLSEIILSEVGAVLRLTHEEIVQEFPAYDYIYPIIRDKDGKRVPIHTENQATDRLKRDLTRSRVQSKNGNRTYRYNSDVKPASEQFYLNISAFGQNYAIVLQRKSNLFAPNAKIYDHAAGGVAEDFLGTDNVYTGYVSNVQGSRVALTNFNGIAGYLRTEGREYFMEPLESDRWSSQRHLIYEVNNRFGKKRTKRSRRDSKRRSYNIEVLVTADDSVVNFHGRDQIQSYLTTLLLLVDEIYQDDSIGHDINIVVVRITLLDHEQSENLISGRTAMTNLKSVCKWTHRNHHVDGEAENGTDYDHAIFLTRRFFGPTGMEGYAHVTGMCHPLRSCTLNREDGFSSAFVVAHETGHVLGMEHDGEGNKCGDETSMGSIMAPLVEAAFNRYHWSRCSESELQGYIRKFSCLQNNPHVVNPSSPPDRHYPGVYYSLDDQCRIDFGKGFRLCTAFTTTDVCQVLWCGHDENPKLCKTKNSPPIDGTACGEGRWCFKSYCVWSDHQGGRRDGGWGEWSNYGACSRSCGTGTRNRIRECNRPRPALGGLKCEGSGIEYGLCNKAPCLRSTDYRTEQCRHHRQVVYGHRRHTWSPYEYDHEQLKCELYCQSKETGVILSMGTPVADGTRCSYDDPYSVCVNRNCLHIGCDGVINSGTKEDECGICGGDGIKQCTRVHKIYKKAIRKTPHGFTKILIIPYKARHVRIRESILFSKTAIGLKNRHTRRWVFKSNHSSLTDDSKQIIESGIKWTYSRTQRKEQFFTVGPLPYEYAVFVSVPTDTRKIKLHYSYSMHSSDVKSKKYDYVVRKWYPCSVTCGRGVKRARYGCMNKVTKRFVRKYHCGNSTPRRLREPCSVPCSNDVRWHTGRWRQCYSRVCNQRGFKTRSVTCQRQMNNEINWTAVPNSQCAYLSEKPISKKSCSKTVCNPQWTFDDWSECSVSCGDGERRRNVRCMVGGREGKHIEDDDCILPKPASTSACSRQACPEPRNPGCAGCQS